MIACCKTPHIVRNTDGCIALLKEPLTGVRFYGHRCRACGTLQVSAADLHENQRRALWVAKRVKVGASMWRDLYRETR